MRFRSGVLVGFGVGYYYGAKAGHERYHQMDRVLTNVRRSRPYRNLRTVLSDTVVEGQRRARELVRDAAFGLEETSPSIHPSELDDTVQLDLRPDPSWN
jgi:hypothetical protein